MSDEIPFIAAVYAGAFYKPSPFLENWTVSMQNRPTSKINQIDV